MDGNDLKRTKQRTRQPSLRHKHVWYNIVLFLTSFNPRKNRPNISVISRIDGIKAGQNKKLATYLINGTKQH